MLQSEITFYEKKVRDEHFFIEINHFGRLSEILDLNAGRDRKKSSYLKFWDFEIVFNWERLKGKLKFKILSK